MIIKSIVGTVALIAAIYFVYKTIQQNKNVQNCNGKKVSATIVNHNMQIITNGLLFYYPIYEYEIDGEVKEYIGKWPMVKPATIGAQLKLNYNEKYQMIVDQTTISANATLAIICGGLAVLAFSI